MDNTLFGRILVDFGLVTDADLERCLDVQRRMNNPKRLGEILIDQGLLDERTLSSILSVQRQKLGNRPGSRGPDVRTRLDGADIAEYLSVARELGASDLFVSTDRVPLVKAHGNLVELPAPAPDAERCREMLLRLLTDAQYEMLERDRHVDVPVVIEGVGRYRANVFHHLDGLGAVFRVLPSDVVALDDLGLPAAIGRVVEHKSGLVLITGATGCGKTTTMAALIDRINRRHDWHVITLEDPIEHTFDSARALITQREVGTHTKSYAAALRAALREDPDVIVIGEIRDPITTQIALTAAETGHLVIGTLHTRSAYSTIVRVIDQFPVDKRDHVRTMLAGVLRAVVCQELVPNIDGRGRSLAAEVMLVNSAIRNLIRENRIWQVPMVMQMSSQSGMQLMDDSLAALVRQKKITVEEAVARSTDESKLGVA